MLEQDDRRLPIRRRRLGGHRLARTMATMLTTATRITTINAIGHAVRPLVMMCSELIGKAPLHCRIRHSVEEPRRPAVVQAYTIEDEKPRSWSPKSWAAWKPEPERGDILIVVLTIPFDFRHRVQSRLVDAEGSRTVRDEEEPPRVGRQPDAEPLLDARVRGLQPGFCVPIFARDRSLKRSFSMNDKLE